MVVLSVALFLKAVRFLVCMSVDSISIFTDKDWVFGLGNPQFSRYWINRISRCLLWNMIGSIVSKGPTGVVRFLLQIIKRTKVNLLGIRGISCTC